MAMVNAEINRQAAMIAYIDDFWLMMWVTLVSVPLVLLLPVVAGSGETRRQIMIYSALLAPLGVAPALLGFAGPGFGVAAAVLGLLFILAAYRVWRGDDSDHKPAKQLFGYSRS